MQLCASPCSQPRHTKSWALVNNYVENNLKVWSVAKDGSVLPTLLPWLEERMDAASYARQQEEEGYILYVCLPTLGVVPAGKQQFFFDLITGFLAARPSNSIAIVIHANRASEAKTKK